MSLPGRKLSGPSGPKVRALKSQSCRMPPSPLPLGQKAHGPLLTGLKEVLLCGSQGAESQRLPTGRCSRQGCCCGAGPGLRVPGESPAVASDTGVLSHGQLHVNTLHGYVPGLRGVPRFPLMEAQGVIYATT